MNDLADLLKGMPSPIETGRRNYDTVMAAGTAQQKEALLLVLRLLADIAPGPHAFQAIEHAAGCLRRAMS